MRTSHLTLQWRFIKQFMHPRCTSSQVKCTRPQPEFSCYRHCFQEAPVVYSCLYKPSQITKLSTSRRVRRNLHGRERREGERERENCYLTISNCSSISTLLAIFLMVSFNFLTVLQWSEEKKIKSAALQWLIGYNLDYLSAKPPD